MAAHEKVVYLVGEGTGETVTKMGAAAISQFDTGEVKVRTFTMINNQSVVLSLLNKAAEEGALVAYTMVDSRLQEFLVQQAKERGVEAVDVLSVFMSRLSAFLGQQPMKIPGKQHQIDSEYFRRIEAIEFTIKHDDGKFHQTLDQADLVLVGLSRTSKTPLSAYLAQTGWKVANIPLAPEMSHPEELMAINQLKVYGLIINADTLVHVRTERLKHLGLSPNAKYANRDEVIHEIEWCRRFYDQHPRWPIIDISGRAIEETAAKIISLHQSRLQYERRMHGGAEGP